MRGVGRVYPAKGTLCEALLVERAKICVAAVKGAGMQLVG
jgi:hypothetical protein